MATLNQYNLYSLNVGNTDYVKSDEVDRYINDLNRIFDYKEIEEYVEKNFGQVDHIALFDYPELNKKISVVINEDSIEICAAKNLKQYYGKGWKLVSKTE